DVYCVEQGRWSGRTETATVGFLNVLSDGQVDEEAARKLAAEARRGKFVASAGNLSKRSRLAVQAGDGQQAQGEVWNAVGQANAASQVVTNSSAFTANYATAEVVDQLKPYIEKIQKPVAGQKQVVGAIVAVNGKVESVDVFGSTPLFKKLWPKLLKSYALDAANAADGPEAKKVCKLADAEKFFGSAMQADVEKSEVEGGLVVTKRDSQGVVSFSASVAAGEDAAEVGGMGFGGSVHSSAFAK
ncbi:MAG: ARPP-1 family domain-containing protein, partial [Planctomycetota bacterium]